MSLLLRAEIALLIHGASVSLKIPTGLTVTPVEIVIEGIAVGEMVGTDTVTVTKTAVVDELTINVIAKGIIGTVGPTADRTESMTGTGLATGNTGSETGAGTATDEKIRKKLTEKGPKRTETLVAPLLRATVASLRRVIGMAQEMMTIWVNDGDLLMMR
jgi:hypothetical protein